MVLDQETQCTTTAVFNKMEDIPNSMLCVSMQRGLSILEEKIEVPTLVAARPQILLLVIHDSSFDFLGAEKADNGKSGTTIIVL